MTFTILGYKITLIHIEKVETFKAQINHEQRAQDVKELTNTVKFQEIKEQAARARELRKIHNSVSI